MSSKSNTDLLEQLHKLVGEEMVALIKAGEATPALLNAAIKFLKDNGISEDFSSAPKHSTGPRLVDSIKNGDFPFEPDMEDIA